MSPEELTADLLRRYSKNQSDVAGRRAILAALGAELTAVGAVLADGTLGDLVVTDAKIVVGENDRPMLCDVDYGNGTLRGLLASLHDLDTDGDDLYASIVAAGLANVVTAPVPN